MAKNQKMWTCDEDSALWQMFYCEGMTQKQIGKVLDRSINSVQRKLSRIRKSKRVS